MAQANGCAEGLKEYMHEYVDPFVEVLAGYSGTVPVVLVMEPDSLPNLVTNQADPRCGAATKEAYTQGLSYAIQRIADAAPHVSMYLDAGHGGWLGWDNVGKDYMRLVCELGLMQHLRGFSTNVANYDPTGTVACPAEAFEGSETVGHYCNWVQPNHPCCLADPCERIKEYNSGPTEIVFAQTLAKHASEICGGYRPHFIIDTGRNGREEARTADCKAWCNLRGAGLGYAPTTDTGLALVDAFFWIKTPGESDGCSATLPDGSACARHDTDCSSPASIGSRPGEPRVPEAGAFFDFQAMQLAAKAVPGFVDGATSSNALRGHLPSTAAKSGQSSRSSPSSSFRSSASSQSIDWSHTSPLEVGGVLLNSAPEAKQTQAQRGVRVLAALVVFGAAAGLAIYDFKKHGEASAVMVARAWVRAHALGLSPVDAADDAPLQPATTEEVPTGRKKDRGARTDSSLRSAHDLESVIDDGTVVGRARSTVSSCCSACHPGERQRMRDTAISTSEISKCHPKPKKKKGPGNDHALLLDTEMMMPQKEVEPWDEISRRGVGAARR